MLIATELEMYITEDNTIVLKNEDPMGEHDDKIVITTGMVDAVCSELQKMKKEIENNREHDELDEAEIVTKNCPPPIKHKVTDGDMV